MQGDSVANASSVMARLGQVKLSVLRGLGLAILAALTLESVQDYDRNIRIRTGIGGAATGSPPSTSNFSSLAFWNCGQLYAAGGVAAVVVVVV